MIVLSTSTDTSPTYGEALKNELNNMRDTELQEELYQLKQQLAEILRKKTKPEDKRMQAQLIFFYEMEQLGRAHPNIEQFLRPLIPFFTTTAMGKNDLMLMLLLHPPTTL